MNNFKLMSKFIFYSYLIDQKIKSQIYKLKAIIGLMKGHDKLMTFAFKKDNVV